MDDSPHLKPKRLFLLKNGMLLFTLGASAVSFSLLTYLPYYQVLHRYYEQLVQANVYFTLAAQSVGLACVILAFLVYEKPIRNYLNLESKGEKIDPNLELRAKRRLLNEPFFVVFLFYFLTILGTVIYITVMRLLEIDWLIIRWQVVTKAHNVLITSVLVFFVLKRLLQRFLAPHFFPDGRLNDVPRVRHITLRVKMFVLMVAINVVPVLSVLRELVHRGVGDQPPEVQMERFVYSIYYIGPAAVILGGLLTKIVTDNITGSLSGIVAVLHRVAKGDFTGRVEVTSNDELGYVGDVVNEMTAGLAERQQMRHSLDLAREVQQSLLPQEAPKVIGLDLAGTSIYCEGTGGDYYDFLKLGGRDSARTGVAVGDVSDHGLQSALLMTTARAFLRQRASDYDSPAHVVRDVNRQLAHDVEKSGHFMTLFFLALDTVKGEKTWVSAGHDPAIVYDPGTDNFTELEGRGPALGLMDDFAYHEGSLKITSGEIIFIGTDGVWETRGPEGEIFGKKRVKDILRAKADRPAQEIVEAVIQELGRFSNQAELLDDVTLVVIKAD